MRRAALTGLAAFKEVQDKIAAQVDFDWRELQYTLSNGLISENEVADYHKMLKKYLKEHGFDNENLLTVTDR